MDVIYIKRDEISNLVGSWDITKISTPITYDRAFDIDKYTRLELSAYLMYKTRWDYGILLVRNARLKDTPGQIPSTELCIPPAFSKEDVFKSYGSFREVIEWNVARAISNITSYGYEDALNYGLIDVADMAHHVLSLTVSGIRNCAVNVSFEGEWVRICSYVMIEDINAPDKCAYVDYEALKRYYRYKEEHGEELRGYRDMMERYSPIRSNNDHRILKTSELYEAFEAFRFAK